MNCLFALSAIHDFIFNVFGGGRRSSRNGLKCTAGWLLRRLWCNSTCESIGEMFLGCCIRLIRRIGGQVN